MRGVFGLALVGVVTYQVTKPTADAAAVPIRKPPALTQPARHAACPVPAGRVSSGWGNRRGGFHDGIDLAAPAGTPIYAVLPGVITVSSSTRDPDGYGQYIEIRSTDGAVLQYGHMRVRYVRAGTRVRAGAHIADVGSEGSSTGPHLHLRVRPHGGTERGVNPVRWLRSRGVQLPCGG